MSSLSLSLRAAVGARLQYFLSLEMREMKGGILEVLLVSAEGIRKPNILGKSGYYVIIQCGHQTNKSKTTSGEGNKVFWNEKFTFKYPFYDWQNFTHLKFKIMDKETFSEDNFVGETIVHLGGITTEENDETRFIELKPTPYNVVLEDDTYKGEIKIGLKFISNVEVQIEEGECVEQEQEKHKQPSMCRTIFSLWQIPQWGFFVFFKKSNLTDITKRE